MLGYPRLHGAAHRDTKESDVVTEPSCNIHHHVAAVSQFLRGEILQLLGHAVSQAMARHAWDEDIVSLFKEQGSEFDKLLWAVGHPMDQHNDPLCFFTMCHHFRAAQWIDRIILFGLYLGKASNGSIIICGRVVIVRYQFVQCIICVCLGDRNCCCQDSTGSHSCYRCSKQYLSILLHITSPVQLL